MDNSVGYHMMEAAYIKLQGKSPLSITAEEYNEIFPENWLRLPIETKIKILDEAISRELTISNTDTYENLIPKDAVTLG